MKRRAFVLGAAGAAAAGGALAWLWPEQGLLNPCLGDMPQQLREHEQIAAAWEGIEPQRVWDCHVHLIGVGDSNRGPWIHPNMTSWAHPLDSAQRLVLLDASCADDRPAEVDARYVERVHSLADALPPGAKLILLAFDHTYTDQGRRDLDASAFHTPDRYAYAVARAHPQRFEWAASIHPYRADSVEALEWATEHGARLLKWLPAAMGIDPASARCDRFYAALARLDVPLLTHAGEEKTVQGAAEPALGNPLRLRRALEHGVRVIVAHCASLGHAVDLDRGPHGPPMASFDLFARMMDEPGSAGRLYGDISAVTQVNRASALPRIVERTDWHSRLLNGSDYPLPGVLPLISVRRLVDLGLLEATAASALLPVRAHNPLLFDFMLKRMLRVREARLAADVFHTRDFFHTGSRSAAAAEGAAGTGSAR